MNKKCIYHDTCWESHAECLYKKECKDYEPINKKLNSKSEQVHLKRCLEIINQNNFMDE